MSRDLETASDRNVTPALTCPWRPRRAGCCYGPWPLHVHPDLAVDGESAGSDKGTSRSYRLLQLRGLSCRRASRRNSDPARLTAGLVADCLDCECLNHRRDGTCLVHLSFPSAAIHQFILLAPNLFPSVVPRSREWQRNSAFLIYHWEAFHLAHKSLQLALTASYNAATFCFGLHSS